MRLPEIRHRVCQRFTKHGAPDIAAYREVCEQRDTKGLYRKARLGELKQFTGVDDPYEEPLNPEVIVSTDRETVEESAAKVIRKLEELGWLRGS